MKLNSKHELCDEFRVRGKMMKKPHMVTLGLDACMQCGENLRKWKFGGKGVFSQKGGIVVMH